jgi:hypothetical protein
MWLFHYSNMFVVTNTILKMRATFKSYNTTGYREFFLLRGSRIFVTCFVVEAGEVEVAKSRSGKSATLMRYGPLAVGWVKVPSVIPHPIPSFRYRFGITVPRWELGSSVAVILFAPGCEIRTQKRKKKPNAKEAELQLGASSEA